MTKKLPFNGTIYPLIEYSNSPELLLDIIKAQYVMFHAEYHAEFYVLIKSYYRKNRVDSNFKYVSDCPLFLKLYPRDCNVHRFGCETGFFMICEHFDKIRNFSEIA